MNENEKNTLDAVADEKLEAVSGGKAKSYYRYPGLVTRNSGTESSGEFPKYCVGQVLKIVCKYRTDTYKLSCKVLSVSATRNCGVFFKEFGYKVEILDNVIPDLKGTVHEDVYENCLHLH